MPLGIIHWAKSSELLARGMRILARCASQAQERICLVGGNWSGSQGRALFSVQKKEKSISSLPSAAKTPVFSPAGNWYQCAQPGPLCSWLSLPWSLCPSVSLKALSQRKALFEASRGWSYSLRLPSFLPLQYLFLPLPTSTSYPFYFFVIISSLGSLGRAGVLVRIIPMSTPLEAQAWLRC